MDADKKKHVNFEQLNALLDFLKEHQGLARGLTRGRRGKLHTLKLWNLCAKKLNIIKDGATKDGKAWSKYWCDWKYRVRRRALELKAAKDSNQPPPDGITPLSQMDEAIISIIGESALDGVIIKSDPLAEGDVVDDVQDTNDQVEDATENKCYGTRSNTSKKRKWQHSSNDTSDDMEEQGGSSSPAEEKPGISIHREKNQYSDSDENTEEFLRIEREKMEDSKVMLDAVQTIASQITRLANVLTDIRDIVINNRINI